MNIQGKAIVITGGASGLGLATARYMVHEKGARVAMLDLNAEAGEAAAAELDAERAMFLQVDVSDEDAVSAAIDAVVARFGAVHVCINAAAIPSPFKILGKDGKAAPLSQFARTIAVNVNGVFNVMSKCVERMATN